MKRHILCAWWQAFRSRWFERPIGMRDLWRDLELEKAKDAKRLGKSRND